MDCVSHILRHSVYSPYKHTQCCLCDSSLKVNMLTFLNVQCGKVSTLPHASSWILIFANRKQKQKQWINFKTNALPLKSMTLCRNLSFNSCLNLPKHCLEQNCHVGWLLILVIRGNVCCEFHFKARLYLITNRELKIEQYI